MSRKILLAITSCIVVFVLMEAALRLFFEPPGVWMEPQTKHLRSPLLGWVLPPNSHSFALDAPVAVNSIGLRDDEIPLRKPKGETRILVLGDSFTFALGIRFDDLYAQILERRLAREHGPGSFQVINAGVAGYNTRQELIYLQSEGMKLEPDLLVVGVYWNDLVGNAAALPDPASTPKIAADADLYESGDREQSNLIPKPLRDGLRKSVLLYLSVQGVKSGLALLNPPQNEYAVVQKALLEGDDQTLAPHWEATAKRLHEIAAVARSGGIPVVLLIFPMETQIRRDYPDLAWSEKLREIWRPTGFPVVDVEPAYRRELRSGRNPFLPYDLHPNAFGMEIAADALYDEILAQGYLDLTESDRPE